MIICGICTKMAKIKQHPEFYALLDEALHEDIDCYACIGTGAWNNPANECPYCDGHGYASVKKKRVKKRQIKQRVFKEYMRSCQGCDVEDRV